PWIRITKPGESGVKEFIGGGSATTRALSVEGPAENQLRRAIIFQGHLLEPMVDQRGFPDAGPGNDGNDIYMLVCPGSIQKSDILLSTKNTASGNRQSGYRDLLWPQSCRGPASDCERMTRGPIPEALTSDCTLRLRSPSLSLHRV